MINISRILLLDWYYIHLFHAWLRIMVKWKHVLYYCVSSGAGTANHVSWRKKEASPSQCSPWDQAPSYHVSIPWVSLSRLDFSTPAWVQQNLDAHMGGIHAFLGPFFGAMHVRFNWNDTRGTKNLLSRLARACCPRLRSGITTYVWCKGVRSAYRS